MRKTSITRALGLAVAAAALCFCPSIAAQQQSRGPIGPAQPSVKQRGVDKVVPDAGRVVGSTYTNDYFGLQLTVPAGWRVADADAARKLDEQGADLVAGDSDERRARLREAASKNINLITMGKVLPTAGGANESAVLIVGAEAVPAWLIKTPQEYIGQARRILESSAMKVSVAEGTRKETLGGVEFAVLDVSSEQPGGLVRQHYYATLKKGYAVFIISTYASEQSAQAIEEVLKSVKFK
ncbi:MAG: hypothetical protein QOG71_2435 [Pyrinomonadaceae bacterium]|nr:hypothetical protein [Pyrinomonadaceae bacterium]